MQDESVFIVVLASMGVTVLALIVTVIVLARSLRKEKSAKLTSKTASSSANEAAKSVASGSTKETRGPGPASSTKASQPEIHPVSVPLSPSPALFASLNVHAEKDAEVDVTRMTALPRLSGESDDDLKDSSESMIDESIARLVYDSEAWIDIEEPTGPNDLILVSAIGQTDRGVTRRRNEDAYVLDTHLQLYAVADGMGGYAGGDVASRMAVEEVRSAIESPAAELRGHEDRPRRGRELIAAVERANGAVYHQAQSARELHGMGTTVVAARFSPKKQRMYVAHVGDSRCYRFRGGALHLLTTDHTLAARGVVGPLAKNISRAVGVAKTVKVDLIVDKPLPGDVFLICSDGLSKMLTDEHIRRILTNHADASLDRAAAQLVLAANAGGGRDNITVILIKILEAANTSRATAILKEQPRVEFGPRSA